MMILTQTDAAALTQYGRALMEAHRTNRTSFEDAAQAITQALYQDFVIEDGSPMFALVRVYRLTSFDELASELKGLVDPARQRWMALAGTWGAEPAWCDRHQSQGHKALNLGSDQSPMVSASIHQLGMDVGVDIPPAPLDLPIPEATFMTRYFHIEHALGSPYIPAQDGFVKPYGIHSVVGLGSNFASRSAYLLLGFSKTHIDQANAMKFSQLAPYVSTLLAVYDARSLWAG